MPHIRSSWTLLNEPACSAIVTSTGRVWLSRYTRPTIWIGKVSSAILKHMVPSINTCQGGELKVETLSSDLGGHD